MTKGKQLLIRTPEGVEFPMQIAGPVTRFFALAIDRCVVMLASSVVTVTLSLVGLFSMDLFLAVTSVLGLTLALGYPIVAEWRWRGQTLGKHVLNLRVIDVQGLRLQFSQVVVRNLLRFFDEFPLGFSFVGGASHLISMRGQRLGDLAANTVVIRHVQAKEPDLDKLLPDKYNSFREYPHLAARLRQSVSPHEAGVSLNAVARRDALDDVERMRLFKMMAGNFRGLVKFPQEATEGLSDERYVRNVVDILFRDAG